MNKEPKTFEKSSGKMARLEVAHLLLLAELKERC